MLGGEYFLADTAFFGKFEGLARETLLINGYFFASDTISESKQKFGMYQGK